MSRDSVTKVALTDAEIAALARDAFGAATAVTECRSNPEGWYNAVYHLALSGPAAPAAAVLKVAPPADIPHLTYETDLMSAEVAVLRALADAGVPAIPAVLAADLSGRTVPRGCLFMESLPGVSFAVAAAGMTEDERVSVRRQIGRIAGAASRVTAPAHGYPACPALQAPQWRQAFERMTRALLDDAQRFGTELPAPSGRLAMAFEAGLALLDDAGPARLTHYDLWDGNVLVDGSRVTGVIDWERAFHGDPLADVVCLTLFEDPAERTALYEGLRETGGRPPDGEADERRLALYRAYLWLIMLVEAKPRGFGGSILLPGSKAARRLMRDLARSGPG